MADGGLVRMGRKTTPGQPMRLVVSGIKVTPRPAPTMASRVCGSDASWNPAQSPAELTRAVHDNLRNLGVEVTPEMEAAIEAEFKAEPNEPGKIMKYRAMIMRGTTWDDAQSFAAA